MRHVFISPHLDDAVLSCGGYISFLAGKKQKILVITIFSDFGKGPVSLSARRYMWHCGALTIKQFQTKRITEDWLAMETIGADHMHLGFTDAYFRRFYPNHSQLFSGRVNPADKKLVGLIEQKLFSLIKRGDVLYGPMGIGGHVDHVIVNQIVKNLPAGEKLFWLDQPYAADFGVSPQKYKMKKIPLSEKDVGRKKTAILVYSSQTVCRKFANSPDLGEEYLIYG